MNEITENNINAKENPIALLSSKFLNTEANDRSLDQLFKLLIAVSESKNELPGNRIMFVDFLKKWLELQRATVAETTFVGYSGNVGRLIKYFTPMKLRLSDVKPVHIQDFYSYKLSEGASKNTVLRYHANIHKALKYAVKLELIPSNPADKIIRPKKETFEGAYYTPEEVNKLFELFAGDDIELCVYIAAYYGLRRSEIIGLRWDSVNFDEKTISINQKISEVRKSEGKGTELIVSTELKTKQSRRTLPLIEPIDILLRKEREKQNKCRIEKGRYYDRTYDGYICRHSDGRLIKPNYFSTHFAYMLKNSTLRKIRLHDLRHTCASLMINNGVSMKEVQMWLGHSNYSTTADIYSHLDYKSKIHSANMIENALDI